MDKKEDVPNCGFSGSQERASSFFSDETAHCKKYHNELLKDESANSFWLLRKKYLTFIMGNTLQY